MATEIRQASRAAHRAAGFTEVGVQRRHGQLGGEWKAASSSSGYSASRRGRNERLTVPSLFRMAFRTLR
jgi:RimJ/RimL family protein N-acetyltransferase